MSAPPPEPDEVSRVSLSKPSGERLGFELLGVLLVSFLMSGVKALLDLIHTQLTVPGGLAKAQTSAVASVSTSPHQWLDILYSVADIVSGVAPAFLAIVLLMRSPGGTGFGIGLDRLRGREAAQGLGFCALIGIPGIGLVWLAHRLGLNAQIVAAVGPDVWYRTPLLILQAAQAGIAEEIVVLAFVLTRLRQLGWSNQRALAASAVLRGSYHLYQGIGGFVGNAIMGLIFGWWFQRTRRVWPLVIAHFLLDAISFLGYIYLPERLTHL